MAMQTIVFDTLAFAKKLTAANFTTEQAEAMAAAMAGMVEDQLATKRDIKELEVAMKEMEISLRRDLQEMETSLRRDMQEMETSLRRDLKEMETSLRRDMQELEIRLKHDLTLRLGGMLAAGIAIVAALVKLL